MSVRDDGPVPVDEHQEDQWISVSDLMAGLMMVFLFISVGLLRTAFLERDRARSESETIQRIALTYQERQFALYRALVEEFGEDLPRWRARIDRATLSFEFLSPEVLFDQGSTELKPRFQEILADFFPRYLQVLDRFRDAIEEVRIEGHTSSIWNQHTSADEAYFLNMALSQGRTRAVLEFVYHLPKVAAHRAWVKKHVAAVGYSSAHLKYTADGREDRAASRRVSFRVVTNAERQIRRIVARGM